MKGSGRTAQVHSGFPVLSSARKSEIPESRSVGERPEQIVQELTRYVSRQVEEVQPEFPARVVAAESLVKHLNERALHWRRA